MSKKTLMLYGAAAFALYLFMQNKSTTTKKVEDYFGLKPGQSSGWD
jgi:hypothetical protein